HDGAQRQAGGAKRRRGERRARAAEPGRPLRHRRGIRCRLCLPVQRSRRLYHRPEPADGRRRLSRHVLAARSACGSKRPDEGVWCSDRPLNWEATTRFRTAGTLLLGAAVLAASAAAQTTPAPSTIARTVVAAAKLPTV